MVQQINDGAKSMATENTLRISNLEEGLRQLANDTHNIRLDIQSNHVEDLHNHRTNKAYLDFIYGVVQWSRPTLDSKYQYSQSAVDAVRQYAR